MQVVETGVPRDDVGEVLGIDVGEDQRRILELVEVVVAVALLQPVELLLEDPGEGRAHLARADRGLGEAANEQVDVVDVDVVLAIGRLEQGKECGLLLGRAAQVLSELRPTAFVFTMLKGPPKSEASDPTGLTIQPLDIKIQTGIPTREYDAN